MERARGSLRRDEVHEFRVGRIKHERVKVPRGDDQLLQWAMQVMKIHADRKAILEVEFTGEEGTGLGPTLEFFALVAAELQSKYFPYIIIFVLLKLTCLVTLFGRKLQVFKKSPK